MAYIWVRAAVKQPNNNTEKLSLSGAIIFQYIERYLPSSEAWFRGQAFFGPMLILIWQFQNANSDDEMLKKR